MYLCVCYMLAWCPLDPIGSIDGCTSMGVLGLEQVLLTTETSVQPFGLLFHTGSVFVALASLEIKM